MAILHSTLALSFLLAALANAVSISSNKPNINSPPSTKTSDSSTSTNTKYIGTAVNVTALTDDKKYREIVTAEFSVLTAENEMKWDYFERTPKKYDTAAADTLNKFIEETGKKLRFHTLVAHNQNPTWISSLKKDELKAATFAHMEQIFKLYSKNMIAIDVCNEILDEGSLRQTIWLQTWGPEFIEEVYTKARELANMYNPKIKLFLNDYSIEGKNAKSNKMFELATSLKKKGILDAVGFQSHLEVGKIPKDFKENLERFTQAGLFVALTELDIRIKLQGRSEEDIAKDRKQQTLDFVQTFDVCASVPKCLGVTLWGVSDNYSWIPKTQGTSDAGEALLFDKDYTPKEAFKLIKSKYPPKTKKRC